MVKHIIVILLLAGCPIIAVCSQLTSYKVASESTLSGMVYIVGCKKLHFSATKLLYLGNDARYSCSCD